MFFILLLALSAFSVAASAAFFSVYGLAQVFAASFIPVVIMGTSLEAGKLIAASFLYRYWKVSPKFLKAYLIAATLGLMIITSGGIFGFLTAAYQKDTIDLKQQQELIVLYEDQKTSYQNRLRGINQQIETVPESYVSKRMELIDTFESEKNDILMNIQDLDSKLIELKGNILTTEAKIGPIIYVAEVLEEDPDDAIFWFVLLLVCVFDPLAVSLTIATNIALNDRKNKKMVVTVQPNSIKVDDVNDTNDTPVVNKQPEINIDAINDIKKLIRDSNNPEKITQLYETLNKLSNEFEQSQIRTNLKDISRK